MNEAIFAPTVEHPITHEIFETAPKFPITKDETHKLEYYKPYLPVDELSRKNLSAWINYPGMLKITRIARHIHKQAELPEEERQDSSQKCSAWKDFRFKSLSFLQRDRVKCGGFG